MVEILISVLLLTGAVATLIGAIGLTRFRDVYTRMHATDKGATLGVLGIIGAGAIFFSVETGFSLKLLLVIPFLFATAPVGSFMLARASLRTGPHMTPDTMRDDLQEDLHMEGERTVHE